MKPYVTDSILIGLGGQRLHRDRAVSPALTRSAKRRNSPGPWPAADLQIFLRAPNSAAARWVIRHLFYLDRWTRDYLEPARRWLSRYDARRLAPPRCKC